ncbi:YrhA family protein [Bacillus alkalicellulosilyticus]|uniref:YrhA family protein n=1 Tax=Alkalihalobacterium alkalicellulosilyticum TaxID=1912214 RepID=UPI00099742DB|nr:YrhA family protein [Bacillus alkalicellulosilyticus]
MWEKMVSEIQKIEESFGSSLRRPATSNEINKMKENIKVQFNGFLLPDSYVNFLKKLNGLDFNGLVIYGVDNAFLDNKIENIDGFVEINEIWHENNWQKQYLFFGDSDTAWYCYDLENKIYLELDKPSGTEMNSFNNFQIMLEEALSSRV